jgi:hypothetical protein
MSVVADYCERYVLDASRLAPLAITDKASQDARRSILGAAVSELFTARDETSRNGTWLLYNRAWSAMIRSCGKSCLYSPVEMHKMFPVLF